jgi:phosphinothricin acetyltransferase
VLSHRSQRQVALPNEPSARLHERDGFSRVGWLAEAGYKLGAWRDVGFWQCMLDGPDENMSPPRRVDMGR